MPPAARLRLGDVQMKKPHKKTKCRYRFDPGHPEYRASGEKGCYESVQIGVEYGYGWGSDQKPGMDDYFESNGLRKIEGLEHATGLRCLCAHRRHPARCACRISPLSPTIPIRRPS